MSNSSTSTSNPAVNSNVRQGETLTVVVPVHPTETDEAVLACAAALSSGAIEPEATKLLFVTSTSRQLSSHHLKEVRWIIDEGATTRAATMNIGFAEVSSPFVLFVHCDTIVPRGYDDMVRKSLAENRFCTFRLAFDSPNLALRIIQWSVNRVRGFPYGDQCFGLRSDFHRKNGGFALMPFMEDFHYVENFLDSSDRNVVLDADAVTSPRRFQLADGRSSNLAALVNCWHNKMIILRYNRGEDVAALGEEYYENKLLPFHGIDCPWAMASCCTHFLFAVILTIIRLADYEIKALRNLFVIGGGKSDPGKKD